jgi:hypothetical protein
MTKLKTISAIGALLLGSSTLAIAQERVQPAAPPAGGSHPEMAAPQNAPDSWTVSQPNNAPVYAPSATYAPSTTVSGARMPGPQMASVDPDWIVRKRIEAAGYDSVHSVTPSLDGYTARAMESGQSVVVDVDGNGNVYRVPNQH